MKYKLKLSCCGEWVENEVFAVRLQSSNDNPAKPEDMRNECRRKRRCGDAFNLKWFSAEI